jgi:hypothetical protein
MSAEYRDAFDQWLEQELRSRAVATRGPSPLPVQARYNVAYLKNGLRTSVFAKAAALASAKGAFGLVACAVAVAAAGVTEAAITGSVNLADWGAQLVQQVQRCAPELIPGSHDMGDCLSTFAPQVGQHSSTGRPSNGTVNPAGDGKRIPGSPTGDPGGGPPSGHPDGGPPMTHPGGGKSSSHPDGGPPTTDGKPPRYGRGGRYGTAGPPAGRQHK